MKKSRVKNLKRSQEIVYIFLNLPSWPLRQFFFTEFFLLFFSTIRLLEESDSFEHFHFEKRGQVKMKGKSEPMTTYILRRAEKSRDLSYAYTMDTMMTHGSLQSSDALLTSSLVHGGFTLNRSRAGSGIGAIRRSRNTSQHASRYNTPGQLVFKDSYPYKLSSLKKSLYRNNAQPKSSTAHDFVD